MIGRTSLGGPEIDVPRFANLVPMRGVTSGDLDEMPLLAGQGVGLIDAVKGAGSLISDITAQAKEIISRYAGS